MSIIETAFGNTPMMLSRLESSCLKHLLTSTEHICICSDPVLQSKRCLRLAPSRPASSVARLWSMFFLLAASSSLAELDWSRLERTPNLLHRASDLWLRWLLAAGSLSSRRSKQRAAKQAVVCFMPCMEKESCSVFASSRFPPCRHMANESLPSFYLKEIADCTVETTIPRSGTPRARGIDCCYFPWLSVPRGKKSAIELRGTSSGVALIRESRVRLVHVVAATPEAETFETLSQIEAFQGSERLMGSSLRNIETEELVELRTFRAPVPRWRTWSI